jgi:hypothetical protein
MKKLYTVLGCVLALLAAPGVRAWSQLSSYTVTAGPGSALDMSGSTMIYNGAAQRGTGQGGFYNYASGGLPIGFTFVFNGTAYTQFSVNSNGLMGLGSGTVTATGSNSLTGAGTYPIIAPFWDQQRVSGGVQGCASPAVHYRLDGIQPNRVLCVEWRDIDLNAFSPRYGTFQVRLYEGSNRIEIYYGRMSACDVCNMGYGCGTSSASVGIAASTSNFISVTPTGPASASFSTTTVFNSVNVNAAARPYQGDMYTFLPCNTTLTGRTGVGNGGTATMNSGDIFFTGFVGQINTPVVYKPFTSKLSDPSCTGTYTMTITGAAAADYYFVTPGTQSVTRSLNSGVIDTVGITFRATAAGVRSATLTVTDPKGFNKSFNLQATGLQTSFIGNLAEGGTATMADADTLLKGKFVNRHQTGNFSPFSMTNLGATPVAVTYSITGGNNQYTITGPSSIGAGATGTPVITFSPTGFGPQPAGLRVTAGTEIHTYILYATSAAPGGDLHLGSATGGLINGVPQFVNQYACLGDGPVSIPVTMVNTGFNDFSITGLELYAVDTATGQGQGGEALRDVNGSLIPISDYVLTDQAVNGPITAGNILPFPISVAQGSNRTIYLTLVAARPGKRYAFAYVRTNGQNFSGKDTNGTMVEGLINFGVYGRGSSSVLADDVKGTRPRSIVFPITKVGASSTALVRFVNPGSCTLRVSMKELQINTGDVKEFTILSMPTANLDGTTGDLLIPPGNSDQQIVVQFSPIHAGTRRATMVLRTNDSTVQIPGLTLHGEYYLDLVGNTPTMVSASDADFGSALIGGGTIEQQHNVIHLENTSGFPVEIDKILIDGADAAEFVADGTAGLPGLPRTMQAGERLDLKLVFAPQAGGQSGNRNAAVKLILSTGDTVVAHLTGFAGTRVLDVTPTDVRFATMSRGKTAHKTVTVTNNGTIPMKLTAPVLPAGGDFSVSSLARTELQPGQSEELEVTYSPTATGSSTGTLTIISNAPANGGIAVVTLNGTASKTHGTDPGDISGSTVGHFDGELSGGNDPQMSTSEVAGEVVAGGVALRQSIPNPSRDVAEISYTLPARGEVTLALYDGSGRLVRVLEQGMREAGEQRVMVRVSDLASGVYHYRLTAAGHTLNQTMTVVR